VGFQIGPAQKNPVGFFGMYLGVRTLQVRHANPPVSVWQGASVPTQLL